MMCTSAVNYAICDWTTSSYGSASAPAQSMVPRTLKNSPLRTRVYSTSATACLLYTWSGNTHALLGVVWHATVSTATVRTHHLLHLVLRHPSEAGLAEEVVESREPVRPELEAELVRPMAEGVGQPLRQLLRQSRADREDIDGRKHGDVRHPHRIHEIHMSTFPRVDISSPVVLFICVSFVVECTYLGAF